MVKLLETTSPDLQKLVVRNRSPRTRKATKEKKKKGNLTDWFGAGDGVKITLCMAQSYDRDKE